MPQVSVAPGADGQLAVAVDASDAAAHGATHVVVSARPAGSSEPAVSRSFTLAHNTTGTVTLPMSAAGAHDVHVVAVASDGSSSETATHPLSADRGATADNAPMIVCVAGNPSIDKLFEVSEIVVGEIHRPDRMIALPGGKGIHVAQVATVLGAEAVVTGLLAGHTGRWVAQALAAEGVTGEWAWGAGETRSSLSVADRATGRLTEFYEDGTAVSRTRSGDAVRSIVDSLLPAADWIALAGSLPDGTSGYSELIESAPAHDVRCAVDSRGHALAEAIDAGADLVKINVHEAAEVLGAEFHGPAEAIRAARAIRRARGRRRPRGRGHARGGRDGRRRLRGWRLARHAATPTAAIRSAAATRFWRGCWSGSSRRARGSGPPRWRWGPRPPTRSCPGPAGLTPRGRGSSPRARSSALCE